MGFIDNLKNIQPIDFNESIIQNGSAMVTSIIDNANTQTDNLWFIISITVLFLFLVYIFMRRDEEFLLELPRAMFVASGWCLILSVGAVLSTLTNSIMPILWFASIFFLTGLMVLRRVEKNR